MVTENTPKMTQVTNRKLYIIGFILPLFSVPAGLIYSFFFVFNKETRRMGAILLLWLLVSISLAIVVNYWLISSGYNPMHINAIRK